MCVELQDCFVEDGVRYLVLEKGVLRRVVHEQLCDSLGALAKRYQRNECSMT